MSAPKQFSAYLVVASTVEGIEVDSVLVDKGNNWDQIWEFLSETTGDTTTAVGRRIARLCPDCRNRERAVGMLGHDGECGSEEVREEARQEIAHAKKKVTAR